LGPGLAIDVGKDAIWVIDLTTTALIASAWLAQVTAFSWRGKAANGVPTISRDFGHPSHVLSPFFAGQA
jgi:hypothetical protein